MIQDLTKEDLQVILDVLNVYDPNDIMDVYPEMGDKKFLDGVRTAWEKVLRAVNEEKRRENNNSERYYWHPEEVSNRNWCEANKVN